MGYAAAGLHLVSCLVADVKRLADPKDSESTRWRGPSTRSASQLDLSRRHVTQKTHKTHPHTHAVVRPDHPPPFTHCCGSVNVEPVVLFSVFVNSAPLLVVLNATVKKPMSLASTCCVCVFSLFRCVLVL